jgi:putative phosphoribosyl transferase
MLADRRMAGRALAQALIRHRDSDPIVLGLARGGVPVADEVARALGGTLDVWGVRKLGAPSHPELAIGAVAEGAVVFLDQPLARDFGVSRADLLDIARHAMCDVRCRIERFRGGRPAPDLRGRVVILVDDGIATGWTMRAAIRAVKRRRPARLIVATPVASPRVIDGFVGEVDEVVCLYRPDPLITIGFWYEDFRQVQDDEVARILASAAPPTRATMPQT